MLLKKLHQRQQKKKLLHKNVKQADSLNQTRIRSSLMRVFLYCKKIDPPDASEGSINHLYKQQGAILQWSY